MKMSAGIVAALLLASCASTRTVTVKQPMTGQFSSYTSLRLEYAPSDVDQALLYYNQFAATLKRQLTDGHYFKSVTTDKGGKAPLVATCQITKVDRPSQAMTLLLGGAENSTVTLEVTFHETQPADRTLASVEVTGNSAERHRSSIGGISLTSSSDLTLAALEAAAGAVTSYVQQNLTPAAQSVQK